MLRAVRDYSASNTTRADGVLIAVTEPFHALKRRPDLDIIKEVLWIETPANDNFTLLSGNYYTLDFYVRVVDSYIHFLEQNLNTQ